jgi:hypothetical protein
MKSEFAKSSRLFLVDVVLMRFAGPASHYLEKHCFLFKSRDGHTPPANTEEITCC